MTAQEIVAVTIDAGSVANNAGRIDAALLFGEGVEFVIRERARSLAVWKKQTEWETLAKAPALFVIVDGKRYCAPQLSRSPATSDSKLASMISQPLCQ